MNIFELTYIQDGRSIKKIRVIESTDVPKHLLNEEQLTQINAPVTPVSRVWFDINNNSVVSVKSGTIVNVRPLGQGVIKLEKPLQIVLAP